MVDVINREHAQGIAEQLSSDAAMRKYLAWFAGDIDMIDGWDGLKEHKRALALGLIEVEPNGRFSNITSLGCAVHDLLSREMGTEE